MIIRGESQNIMSFRIVKAVPCLEEMRPKQKVQKEESWRFERDTSESKSCAQRSGSKEDKWIKSFFDIHVQCRLRFSRGRDGYRWIEVGAGCVLRCAVSEFCRRAALHFHGSLARWESAHFLRRTDRLGIRQTSALVFDSCGRRPHLCPQGDIYSSMLSVRRPSSITHTRRLATLYFHRLTNLCIYDLTRVHSFVNHLCKRTVVSCRRKQSTRRLTRCTSRVSFHDRGWMLSLCRQR